MIDLTTIIDKGFKFLFAYKHWLFCQSINDPCLLVFYRPYISPDGFLTLVIEDDTYALTKLFEIYKKRCLK